MDLKDKLEEIAEDYGWKFVYARRDYQNLHDVSQFISDEMEDAGNGETVMFVDPIEDDDSKDTVTVFSGNFMVITSSNLADRYNRKFKVNIDPLKQIVRRDMKRKLICEYDINLWKHIEVINMFDFNADGVSVRFNLTGYH